MVLVLRAQGPASSGAPAAETSPPPRAISTPLPTAAEQTLSCSDNPATDTPALQAAITAAEAGGATVSIPAGTCALDDHLVINAPVTVSGAGPSATRLVQQAHADIFGISADNVTVENLNLDTATFNASAPDPKNPNPSVLYSTGNNTTVTNVVAEAGSGFGLRITGPQPCNAHSRGGAAVSNVNMTNTGTGGFASIDVDCQSRATITNITVHGGIVSIFRDSNVTLDGEVFAPGPAAEACAPPWFVTSDSGGSSQNISIANVTSSGGRGVVHGTVPNLVITNESSKSGCH